MKRTAPARVRSVPICIATAAAVVLLCVGPARAATGDCGVIATAGAKPLASDCLGILGHAVAKTGCTPFPACTCDVDGSGTILASDALLCLNVAVGNPAFSLHCSCTTTTTVTTVTSSSTTSSSTSTTVPAPTWTEVQAILASNCAGAACHTNSGSSGGLSGLDDYNAGYANLVNANSTCAGTAFTKRVVPGSAATSFLMHKLDWTQDCGPTMPFGRSQLPGATRDTIRAWIEAGALKN